MEKFVDKNAEFVYVAADQVMTEARKQGATPYDVKDVELGHRGPECSFDAFVRKYGLAADPAMAYMAKVIRGADTTDKAITPESRVSRRSWREFALSISRTISASARRRGRSWTLSTRTARPRSRRSS
ncbi:MAG: chromate resistance protein [Chloroflexi bacterium]|nr:MAG: chromate resistance protein [Chloroflexota bacterium]